MAMNATTLRDDIISAIDTAMGSIDKSADNENLATESKEAVWGSVATAIVAHLKDNLSVGFTGNEDSGAIYEAISINVDNVLYSASGSVISTTVE